MCDFRAGDRVECIDDRPLRPESRSMPALGMIYTVASVRAVGDGFSVRLREIIPTCHRGGDCGCGRCGWDSQRFRLVYRPDDSRLEVFRQLLKLPCPA
jgi:hypothetical protein